MFRWGRLRKGFTLIEVLTIILIIGILASIGFYGYNQYLIRARDAKRIADLETIKAALERFFADNGFYPYFEKYDLSPSTNDFAMPAKFQLQNIPGKPNNCLRVEDKLYLAPHYIPTIPEDPLYKFEYAPTRECRFKELERKQCNPLNTNCQYLYTANNKVSKSRTGDLIEPNQPELRSARTYVLLAATERASSGKFVVETDLLNEGLVNITDSTCNSSKGECPCKNRGDCPEEACAEKGCGSCEKTTDSTGFNQHQTCLTKCLNYLLLYSFQAKGYRYFMFQTKND